MVALLKKQEREQRHYECGPLSQDVPLKVFNETDQLDYAENIRRLSATPPWAIEQVAFVVVLAGFTAAALAIAVMCWGWHW